MEGAMRVHRGVSPVAEPMAAYRALHGLTQAQAAARLGVAQERWSRWETGAVWPDPAWRARILALCLGTPGREGAYATGPFARSCRQFRQREAVTQAEAAALLGVDERTWRRWENGESAPKRHSREFWRTLNRPAAALKVRSGT
jgi:transcriptional regulator with XRE-family HTH domain